MSNELIMQIVVAVVGIILSPAAVLGVLKWGAKTLTKKLDMIEALEKKVTQLEGKIDALMEKVIEGNAARKEMSDKAEKYREEQLEYKGKVDAAWRDIDRIKNELRGMEQ